MMASGNRSQRPDTLPRHKINVSKITYLSKSTIEVTLTVTKLTFIDDTLCRESSLGQRGT